MAGQVRYVTADLSGTPGGLALTCNSNHKSSEEYKEQRATGGDVKMEEVK